MYFIMADLLYSKSTIIFLNLLLSGLKSVAINKIQRLKGLYACLH